MEKSFLKNKKTFSTMGKLKPETKDKIRIVVLMFLIFVATYHMTAKSICNSVDNHMLDKNDKFGLTYKCVEKPQIVESYKNPSIYDTNFTFILPENFKKV